MVLPFALLLFGGILLTAAIKNQSLIDTALAKQDAAPLTSGGGGSGDPLAGASSIASPGATLAQSHKGGTSQFDGHPVANWIIPALKWARKNGWSGTVISGYRSEAEQTRIWDSGTRPAARPKSRGGAGSNHSRTVWPGGAVDVTNPDEFERVLKHYPGLLKPKRDPSIGDPPHFSGTGR